MDGRPCDPTKKRNLTKFPGAGEKREIERVKIKRKKGRVVLLVVDSGQKRLTIKLNSVITSLKALRRRET